MENVSPRPHTYIRINGVSATFLVLKTEANANSLNKFGILNDVVNFVSEHGQHAVLSPSILTILLELNLEKKWWDK